MPKITKVNINCNFFEFFPKKTSMGENALKDVSAIKLRAKKEPFAS
jgi:hypothetical protein